MRVTEIVHIIDLEENSVYQGITNALLRTEMKLNVTLKCKTTYRSNRVSISILLVHMPNIKSLQL